MHITREGLSWGAVGSPATVSYAFRSSKPGYSFASNDMIGTFERFDAKQKDGARLALSLWADVANIVFTPVAQADGYSNDAKILLAAYNKSYEQGADYAFGYSPGNSHPSDGDVWFNNHDPVAKDMTFGRYGFQTMIHEIGHAIGLGHPGDYDATEGPATYEKNAEYIEDTRMYSVMSYFDESHTGANHNGLYASSPLIHDIAALQRLYGANMSTRTENTTYGFNANANRSVFRIDSALVQPIFAVWDAGGSDTFDFSGYAQNQLINLRPESFSDVGGLARNVSIAAGVVIENARGGSGSDTIIGNGVVNVIWGGNGNDRILSSFGADVLFGEDGDDVLDGEQDADRLYGGPGNDNLFGADGNDLLDGEAGADRMEGGAGDDSYVVDSVHDWVLEAVNAGTDQVSTTLPAYLLPAEVEILVLLAGGLNGAGNGLANQITGNASANRLEGAEGGDTLWGHEGADTLIGGGGADVMAGGSGSDFYLVDNAWDRVLEDAFGDLDIVSTTVSYALEAGAEVEALNAANPSEKGRLDLAGNAYSQALSGNAGVNRLSGADGNDVLRGWSGNDVIKGGSGNDWLYGGSGKDVLHGERGRDMFVFDSKLNKKTNVDTIKSYVAKDDTIRLENKVFKKIGGPGKLKADYFWSGKAAHDSDDRVIYNKSSGALYYDVDGIGDASPIKFAQLNKAVKLSPSDFYVI